MNRIGGIVGYSLTLALLAFTLRLVHLIEVSQTPFFEVPIGDGLSYYRWAVEIASGNWLGDQTFYQAPFYPYFLALLRAFFGESFWVPRLAQIALGAASCGLLAFAGARLISTRVGVLAGASLALYAPAIYYDGLLQKASLGLFFSSALLFFVARVRTRAEPGWILGMGMLLGCFALTRENALILVPWVALWLWLGFGDSSRVRQLRWPGWLLLGISLVLVPVGLRNQAVGGRFLITTSQAGPNFYIGNGPQATGRYVPLVPRRGSPRFERDDARTLAETQLDRPLDPAAVSSFWLGRSLEHIAEHPLDWLRLMNYKAYLFWHANEGVDTDSFEAYREVSKSLDVLALVFHFGWLAPFGLFGLWTTRMRWRELWPVYGILAGLAASVVVFYVLGRYRAPIVPPLLLFSSAGVFALVDAGRRADWRVLATGIVIVGLGAGLAHGPEDRGTDARAITYFALGLGLFERGRYPEAVDALEQTLDWAPDFSEARRLLGRTHQASGDLEESERELRAALERDPHRPDLHSALGATLALRGDADAARAAYERALGLEAGNSVALQGLARLRFEAGQIAEAIPLFERAVAARPDDPDFLSNLAVAHAAAGAYTEAIEVFERALRIDRNHLGAILNRAATLERAGRGEEALSAYQRLLASDAGSQLSPALLDQIASAIARLERVPAP
ncbi:MAG: tetratricopeptide repeat protein [bacterium]|nr:tetratricopeptide repeat protein [bacterium]